MHTGDACLREHPGASAAEALEHLRARREDTAFLRAPEDRPGRYVIPRGTAEISVWLERLLRSGRIEVEDPAREARRIAASPEALALLAADTDGRLLLRAVELRRRTESLKALRAVAEDPTATEQAVTGSSAAGSSARPLSSDSSRPCAFRLRRSNGTAKLLDNAERSLAADIEAA